MGKIAVAPLVGAWIEITQQSLSESMNIVAPLVGAWIEMREVVRIVTPGTSLPLWERGLKLIVRYPAWELTSRSPCGSVD